MFNTLTTLFYTFSSALLIPTELALIFCFLLVCYYAGASVRERWERRTSAKTLTELENALIADPSFDAAAFLNAAKIKKGSVAEALKTLVEAAQDRTLIEKRIADFENFTKAKCRRVEQLVKIGPALGLMGTLIPMGPALLGLAQGNLDVLASNLVVAFSTTVVGITIALIASIALAAQKKWGYADFALINFVVDRVCDQNDVAKERA